MSPEEPFLGKAEDFFLEYGIVFNSPDLMRLALTHLSYSHESKLMQGDNERLEFLGDAVLGLVVSHYLYVHLPDLQEGALAKMKSYLVNTEFLAGLAREIKLGDLLLIGKGEEISGGRARPSLLADAFEAVLGAIYLDQGLEKTQEFLVLVFGDALKGQGFPEKDFKSLLQEQTQRHFKTLPRYKVVKEEGPPHRKTFHVQVVFAGEQIGQGSGPSKKEASQAAAREALENLTALLERGMHEEG
jgi:ribonuclease-3